jgi:hypothetical protein
MNNIVSIRHYKINTILKKGATKIDKKSKRNGH